MFILNTLLMFEIIVLVHEMGHFLIAKKFNILVSEFSIGFGPAILKRQKEKTKYCLRLFLMGGFVNFKDSEFEKATTLKKILVILAGPFFNVMLGLSSIALVLVLQGKFHSLEVESVKDFCNQIKINDEIKSVNKKHIFSVNDLLYELQKIPLKDSVNLTIKRNGKKIEISNVGKIIKTNEGEKKYLGISLKIKKLNFLDFIVQIFKNFMFILKMIFTSVLNIFKGKVILKEILGPVGLLKIVDEAEEGGICSLIFLFSFLTINIGVFNLLPLFVLDGGQILSIMFQHILKKRINRNFQFVLNCLEIGFLIFLFIIITIKDILNFAKTLS